MPEFKNKEEYEKWKSQKAKEIATPQKIVEKPAPKSTEKKCPHCAMMIPTDAKICPHCRKQQPSKTKTYIVLGIIAFIVLTTLVSFISNGLSDKPVQSSVPKEPDREYEACVFSKEFVKEFLKAPSTAKFGDCEGLKNADGIIIIASYVDAQNSFGAMLRNNYAWHGHYANNQWVVDYFAMDGKIVINKYKD